MILLENIESIMDKYALKSNLKNYYDTDANLRNSKSINADWKVRVREEFTKLLKHENVKTLLELGAGAGHDSLHFKDMGINVVAIDLSTEMVKKCIEKGIASRKLINFRNICPKFSFFNFTSPTHRLRILESQRFSA